MPEEVNIKWLPLENGEVISQAAFDIAEAVDERNFATAARILQSCAVDAGYAALTVAVSLGPLPEGTIRQLRDLLADAEEDDNASSPERVN